jgi:hypothetical protein
VKRAISILLAAASMVFACAAHAGGISDTGVNAYWGSDSHGYGDVIGDSTYDIQGATISRVGTVLTIVISTNFAGNAGIDSSITAGGIGYGDVFLANTWNPYGTDPNHVNDNASNGTLWSYGFSLDNRYSNTGGSFELYQLNGKTNATDVLTSNNLMKCQLGVSCYYRDGQAAAVNTTSSTVKDTGLSGKWSVSSNALTFTIDIAKSSLVNYNTFAMHWGETCQNDVIEGQTSVVPLPGTLPLLGLGLGALLFVRRRRML